MYIRIATSDVFLGDAIGNFSIALLSFFKEKGFNALLYARYYNFESTPEVRHLDNLRNEIDQDDILFAQYSIFEPSNELYHLLPNKKIVYYHGITPPDYFSNIDLLTEENCQKGISQAAFFANFDLFLANSKYMLNELIERINSTHPIDLKRCHVMPPVIGLANGFSADGACLNIPFNKFFLYVGRLAPHKKLEDLLEWFEFYSDLDPEAGLVIVGSDAPHAYGKSIRDIAATSVSLQGKIYFAGHVSKELLGALYSRACAFITLSRHEGFCVPIIEAMGSNVPVFARSSTAIPETIGCHESLLNDDDLEGYARYVWSVMSRPNMIDSLLQKQKSTYESLAIRANGNVLLTLINKMIDTEIHNK